MEAAARHPNHSSARQLRASWTPRQQSQAVLSGDGALAATTLPRTTKPASGAGFGLFSGEGGI